MPFCSRPEAGSGVDANLLGWIEKFNKVADEKAGIHRLPPSVIVFCHNADVAQTDQLHKLGAIVIDRARLSAAEQDLDRLWEHLHPTENVDPVFPPYQDSEEKLDQDTVNFLDSDPDGITDDDRQRLLEILGRE